MHDRLWRLFHNRLRRWRRRFGFDYSNRRFRSGKRRFGNRGWLRGRRYDFRLLFRRRWGFGRRRRRFGRRWWREDHLDPASGDRLEYRRSLIRHDGDQQRQANGVPRNRYRQRKLDAVQLGPAASAISDTFENPAWLTRPSVSISCA